jgi:hypothetical protein
MRAVALLNRRVRGDDAELPPCCSARPSGKEIVRGENRRGALDVSAGVRKNGDRFAAGETVYLLREVDGGRQIHEIGTRAHVLADHGAVVVLHLDGGEAEVVTCPADHVARALERVARPPVPRAAPVLRPSMG